MTDSAQAKIQPLPFLNRAGHLTWSALRIQAQGLQKP